VHILDNDGGTGYIAPGITNQPLSQTIDQGGTVSFGVGASGTAPLGYQWRFNGIDLPGATTASLIASNAQLAQAGDYTVAGSNPGAATTSAAANLLVFAPGAIVNGGLRREVYSGTQGSSIGDLPYSPNYPDLPDITSISTTFELPVNFADNYGARLSGFVLPPVTGSYTFYINSDDQSALWLSTDAQPANLQLIAAEPEWNNSRQFINGSNQGSRGTPAFNVSTPIALQAGRRYYVTALMKEGSGGDNLAVAWQTPGGPAVTNGSPPIPGANLAYLNLAPIITSQPLDQVVPLGGYASFGVTTMGTRPLRYQWQRNGASIGGATNRLFSIGSVQITDAANYSVVVSGLGAVTSRVARLTFPGFTLPRFTGVPNFSNGVFLAQLTGATGLVLRVDVSTNFLTWQAIQTLTNITGQVSVTDSNASTRKASFYRAVVP
jgi:hypothetical protein